MHITSSDDVKKRQEEENKEEKKKKKGTKVHFSCSCLLKDDQKVISKTFNL